MSTAVVIHGCHLQAINWEEIAFGRKKENELGRYVFGVIPRAIEAALFHDASYLFWGTGASKKIRELECEYAYRLACERVDEIHQLVTNKQGNKFYKQKERIELLLKERSYLDKQSKNLTEEVDNALAFCVQKNVFQVIPVSSPTHIQRCFAEFITATEKRHLQNLKISPMYSEIGFAGASSKDVVVVEPPHRGDLPMVPFHKTVKRLFKFLRSPNGLAFDLNDDLNQLIDDYKHRLTK